MKYPDVFLRNPLISGISCVYPHRSDIAGKLWQSKVATSSAEMLIVVALSPARIGRRKIYKRNTKDGFAGFFSGRLTP